MRNIFLVIAILTFAMFPLFAQEADTTDTDSPPTNDTAGVVSTNDTEANGTSTNDNVSRLDYVIPKFPGISSIDDALLQQSLDKLTNYVSVIRDDYLFRLVYKIDKIVERYTNDNYIDTNSLDYVNLNVYDIVSDEVAGDNNVSLGIREADEALIYLKNVKDPLIAIGKPNDVAQIENHLNLYSGILNMYGGSKTSMKKALNNFSYLLDSGFVDDNIEMDIRLNTYIASINYELLESEYSNDILRKVYYNDMFNALWNIVDKSTTDEAIKDAKFMVLINQFYTVIFTDTAVFKSVYSKYFDKLGYNYGQTEETILEKPVMDEYQDTTDDTTTESNASDDMATETSDDTTAAQ